MRHTRELNLVEMLILLSLLPIKFIQLNFIFIQMKLKKKKFASILMKCHVHKRFPGGAARVIKQARIHTHMRLKVSERFFQQLGCVF